MGLRASRSKFQPRLYYPWLGDFGESSGCFVPPFFHLADEDDYVFCTEGATLVPPVSLVAIKLFLAIITSHCD